MTVATVRTPAEGFTGTVVGVRFAAGVATGVEDPAALAYFERQGYVVVDAETEAKPRTRARKAGSGDTESGTEVI